MLRLLASTLILSSNISGRRKDMVLVEDFKFGITTGYAWCQSKNALESWASQKARSSASEWNAGICLFFLIYDPFFFMHRSRRNDPNQGTASTQGESDMQPSTLICLAQCVILYFSLAVLTIKQQKQGLIKKYLLCFKLANSMLVNVFSSVASIPIKARYCAPIHHVCILLAYP